MTVKKPDIRHTFTIDWHTRQWGRGKMAPAPEYVVVHFTGSGKDGGSAIATYKDWLTRPKGERGNSHYIVDASGIYEGVDPKKYGCLYACAAKEHQASIDAYVEKYGGRGPLCCDHIKVAGNYNTINIEACSAKRTPVRHGSDAYMDDDFYFPNATYRNLVSLVSWLLDEFSIPPANLIMHHQISGKLCPAMWCNSPTALNGWSAFKNDVLTVMNRPVMAPDLPDPSGEGTAAATSISGEISVKRGDPIYMSPGGIEVGFIDSDKSLKYKFIRSGYYYTDEGYVKGGS